MRAKAVEVRFLFIFMLWSLSWGTTLAQRPPLPKPDPGSPDQHIFYGVTPFRGDFTPVLVFIHGIRGIASDWWVSRLGIPNNMYDLAFINGYRTAFVSLSTDNSPNDSSIEDNALVLKEALPKIAARFGVSSLYLICHSKGGLDTQAAMLDPNVSKLVKAVFNIGTPNTGTELADFIFNPANRDLAERLGLLTPGVEALKTSNVAAFRAQADPILASLNIPFYTMAGSTFLGHPLTLVTGPILAALVPGVPNDGFVPESRTNLPISYGIDVGEVRDNHFEIDSGGVSFPKINAHITGLEQTVSGFKRIASNGFGDFSPEGSDDSRFNTWMWSMQSFKGKLYVGVGRAVQCASFATAAVQSGNPAFYPPIVGDCPEDARDLPLSAEIWRYTAERDTWVRVFKSPENVPIQFDQSGQPVKFTARDTGFRGMAVFKETSGVEALYVAGTTSSSIFDNLPFYQVNGFPPPRILRSVDGENFEAIPQDPGTFLGDIVENSSQVVKARGFRSMAVYKNKLFVTATDFRGVGFIVASENPEQGNDAWQRVSPPVDVLPVWTLKVFNNFLYCTTGDRQNPEGYGVFKTDAEGDPPFNFIPIVTNGAEQPVPQLRSPSALSLEEFQGKLYVGTDRPTELIRINTDDTFELVVGHPRVTTTGAATPISGIGQWFGSFFNGHFWRMKNFDGQLYLGTWDWSQSFRTILTLDSLFRPQYGTDVFRTKDGIHWSFVTKSGFGNPFNYGTRSLEATPFGLFLGTAKPEGGGEVYLNQSNLSFDEDDDIDENDLEFILEDLNSPASTPTDPRDLDEDGRITVLDARKLILFCAEPRCEEISVIEIPNPPPPQNLRSSSIFVVGQNVALSWDPVDAASSYRVFRSEVRPIVELFPPDGITITLPGLDFTVTIPDDFLSGVFDQFCEGLQSQTALLAEGTGIFGLGVDATAFPEGLLCFANRLFQNLDQTSSFLGLPLRFVFVAPTILTSYSEPAPTGLQSIYFVVAVDAEGRISDPSNIVGGPSFALP